MRVRIQPGTFLTFLVLYYLNNIIILFTFRRVRDSVSSDFHQFWRREAEKHFLYSELGLHNSPGLQLSAPATVILRLPCTDTLNRTIITALPPIYTTVCIITCGPWL